MHFVLLVFQDVRGAARGAVRGGGGLQVLRPHPEWYWEDTSSVSFFERYVVPGEGRRALAEACKGFGLTLSGIGGMLKLTHTSSVAFFKTYVVHPASVKLFDEYIVKDTGRCALAEGCKRLDLSLAAIGTRFNLTNCCSVPSLLHTSPFPQCCCLSQDTRTSTLIQWKTKKMKVGTTRDPCP